MTGDSPFHLMFNFLADRNRTLVELGYSEEIVRQKLSFVPGYDPKRTSDVSTLLNVFDLRSSKELIQQYPHELERDSELEKAIAFSVLDDPSSVLPDYFWHFYFCAQLVLRDQDLSQAYLHRIQGRIWQSDEDKLATQVVDNIKEHGLLGLGSENYVAIFSSEVVYEAVLDHFTS
jgi:hypothetical protein